MGVMNCSRKACDNIMCDTYVDHVGYVCNDCQKEFKEYLDDEDLKTQTEGELHTALKVFINTRKDHYIKNKNISVDDFFKLYTKN